MSSKDIISFARRIRDTLLDALQKNADQIEKFKDQYRRLDDKQLMEKYRNTSGIRKLACIQLLNERGYRNQ